MLIAFYSFILFILFIALGIASVKLVDNVKIVSLKLGASLFTIGLVLSLFTTLPELLIGFNALADNYAGIPVGNLFGGIIVMLSLILGLSAILNKKIKTDGYFRSVTPFLAFIILALFLGLKGYYQWYEGIIFCLIYLILIYYNFKKNKYHYKLQVPFFDQKKVTKEILYIITGTLAIIIFSELIVRISEAMLVRLNITGLTLGLLIFSIGTNLPELSIALTSWQKKTAELSLSNLLGSAICNILIIGILSLFKTLSFTVDASYYSLIVFIPISFLLFMRFYKTDKKINQKEGLILMAVYLLFILTQVFL